MTDKEKLLAEIEKRYEYWKEKEHHSHSVESEIRMSECQHLLQLLNSLPEESVSEDLEEKIGKYCSNPENFITYIDVGFKQSPIKKDDIPLIIKAIKAGAQWQKKAFISKACDWLTKHAKKYYFNEKGYLGTDELVEDFKLIMEM